MSTTDDANRGRTYRELADLVVEHARLADRYRNALRLTRPALVAWDDYDKGTVWCCCCDRQIADIPPTDCPHGEQCPVTLTHAG